MKNKKISLLLALLLSLSLCLPAAAAFYEDNEITGISDVFGQGGYSTNGGAVYRYSDLSDFAYLHSTPAGTTYFLPLRVKDFEWEKDNQSRNLNMSMARELGISLYVDYRNGNNLFDAIKLVERDGTVGILIDFVDVLVAVEPEEFEVEAKLLVYDTEYEGSVFKIRGNMTNRGVTVNTYDTKCNLGKNRYAFAYDTVKNVQFNLGEGVSIAADIGFTDKYYGMAVATPNEIDVAIMAKHPAIEKVLHIDTIGLRGKVRVEADQVLYLYDESLDYLGTTQQAVSFRNTYYLAHTKL